MKVRRAINAPDGSIACWEGADLCVCMCMLCSVGSARGMRQESRVRGRVRVRVRVCGSSEKKK